MRWRQQAAVQPGACSLLSRGCGALPTAPGSHRCRAAPARLPQLVDKQQDLVRVQKAASFNSINIQASTHMLADDESPLASVAATTAALKGGDGYDRLLEHRCGRYLFHHGQATFLPVPPSPPDFANALHAVAGSRNIKGAGAGWARQGVAVLPGHLLPSPPRPFCGVGATPAAAPRDAAAPAVSPCTCPRRRRPQAS